MTEPIALAGNWRALQSQSSRLLKRDVLATALAVAIVEPIQVRAVPLAALALVATVLMPALPHLPLEGASGPLVVLQDLDGALLVALLSPPPLQFGLDPDPQPLQLLRGGVLDLRLGQHPCPARVLCSVEPQHTGMRHTGQTRIVGELPLDRVPVLQEGRKTIACPHYG